MTEAILKIKNLQVGYDHKALTTPINLALPRGQSLGILGGNGSGKTSLMKTLLGLIPSISGTLKWRPGVRFGYVPQENPIDPIFPITVRNFLAMGDFPRRGSKKKKNSSTQTLLKEMQLESHHLSLYRELSGGQKQRALLGRALKGSPEVLLLDEPLNNLDYAFRKTFWRYLQERQEVEDLNLILIEHDINRIINEVSWVILLGPHRTLSGRAEEIFQEDTLIEALETPLKVQKENGKLQVYFL